MKNYLKMFTPFLLAILIGGSLSFVIGQSKTGGSGNSARSDNRGGGPGRGDFGTFGLNPRLLDRLNLTAEQRTQIAALQETARTGSGDLIEQLQTVREEIRTATQNGAFNETQIRALLATKANIQIELELIRLRTDAAIYNLLTAEQRALLETLRQQHQQDRAPNRFGN